MEKIFAQSTVLVTGGLGDIGRAICLEFASMGANIAIGDIHPSSSADSFLQELRGFSVLAHYKEVDVTDAAAVRSWIDEAESHVGISDIIIPNAAVVTFAGIMQITPEQWARELRVNLDGAFHVSQYATARMLHHGRAGHVVFVGSWAAHSVHTHIPAYCASKAGLRMLCKCLALELAPHNILVNEIAPGYVDAGLSGRSFEKDPVMKQEATQRVPVKKLITPAEVARQISLLCHPQNQHITGAMLLMDGGLSLLC